MLIKKVSKLKNNKYKIFFDNESIITYDNVIIENDLLFKKSIDQEAYNKILIDTEFYTIYNLTLNSIMRKRKSENEVRKFLSKYNIENRKKEDIIKKLKSINLINDEDYCKAYINDQIYISKKGINRIKKELVNKKISEETINNSIQDIDKTVIYDNLKKTIMKKIKQNNKYSKNYIKHKIANEMINNGYEKSDIFSILEEIELDDTTIIKKEFNKAYITLSKKYSDTKLKEKVIQKLASKGFNLEDVKKLLDKKTED